MKYSDLLKAHLKYGTTSEDLIIKYGYQNILENVIIAPWWGHEMFNNLGLKVEQMNEQIFNFSSEEISFSFIELKKIGAPAIMDYVLGLGVTKCKNLVFLGSAGAIDENIKIGDIVLPEYSICLDGASRYLNANLEDEFLKKEYPTETFSKKLFDLLKEKKIEYKCVPNISIDTIFAQFYHLDRFIELGAKTVEMETANVFKCASVLNINAVAIFCISDNTVLKKSLCSGRTDEENVHRHKVRNETISRIVVDLFKSIKNDK